MKKLFAILVLALITLPLCLPVMALAESVHVSDATAVKTVPAVGYDWTILASVAGERHLAAFSSIFVRFVFFVFFRQTSSFSSKVDIWVNLPPEGT